MNAEILLSFASVIVAVLALIFTTILLSRQVRHMERERNALAMMQAIERLSDPAVVQAFERLRGVEERYPDDESFVERFGGSQDERDIYAVASFMETIAVLTRRGALDPSLIVDAYGYGIRRHWNAISVFVERFRRVEGNPDLFNNFEWLAKYSAWWKEIPRPANDPNYDPRQFAVAMPAP